MPMVQDAITNLQKNVQSFQANISNQRKAMMGQRSGQGMLNPDKKPGLFGFGILPMDKLSFMANFQPTNAESQAPYIPMTPRPVGAFQYVNARMIE